MEITDIASSTRAGVFVMTRTTGVPSGSRSSRNVVGIPAAPLMTRRPAGIWGASSSSSAPMSWGLTVRIRVSACLAASWLVTGTTPWRTRSSSARSGRRAVMKRSAGGQPDRMTPLSSASPIFPVPRTATFWGMTCGLPRDGCCRSSFQRGYAGLVVRSARVRGARTPWPFRGARSAGPVGVRGRWLRVRGRWLPVRAVSTSPACATGSGLCHRVRAVSLGAACVTGCGV